MNSIFHFLKQPFWHAKVGDYLAFLLITLLAFLLKKPFARLLAKLTSGIATRLSGGKYRGLFRSLIRKPLEWLFAVVVLFYALNFIEAPLYRIRLLRWHGKDGHNVVRASFLLDKLFIFFGIVFLTLLLSRIIDFIYRAQAEHARLQLQRARAQILPLLRDMLKIVLWTMGFFWMLGSVFSVNIPALITGLGIGGVALALAAKESIENFFAAFTILADKPFAVDDSIRLGALEGKVERIGFRSTRLRTIDGTVLIIPNKKLVDDNLENLSAREQLVLRLSVPVKYTAPPYALDDLLERIRKSVAALPEVNPPVSAAVDSFTENAFVVLVTYTVSPSLAPATLGRVKAQAAERVYAEITAPGS
jgi:MscS family membrane protein